MTAELWLVTLFRFANKISAYGTAALNLASTMLEIGPRSRMKKELTNRNDHVIKLFKCDLLIFFSVQDLDSRFLASWTSGFGEARFVGFKLTWGYGVIRNSRFRESKRVVAEFVQVTDWLKASARYSDYNGFRIIPRLLFRSL